jgi:hypothetical protein
MGGIDDDEAGFERACRAGDGRLARHWCCMTGQTIVLNGGMAFI